MAALWQAIGRAWRWLGVHKDSLAVVFALVAAGWALLEYRDRVDSARQAETARFMERYHGTTYLDARLRLNRFLYMPATRRLLLDARAQGGDALLALATDQDLLTSVLTLREAYEALAICVESAQCSPEVACRYFASDILALHDLFRPLFTQTWAQMWGEVFMQAPVAFAKACPKPPETPAAASAPVPPVDPGASR
jgi:hypothetical protein